VAKLKPLASHSNEAARLSDVKQYFATSIKSWEELIFVHRLRRVPNSEKRSLCTEKTASDRPAPKKDGKRSRFCKLWN
jgi:hypothetical protein